MNLGDLTTLVRELLADEVNFIVTDSTLNAGQTWSASQYQEACNFAVKLYCQKKGVSYAEDAKTVTSGYISKPSDHLEITRVVYDGEELAKSTMAFEYLKSPTWTSATATAPKRWVDFSGLTIRLAPTTTTYASCTVGYIEMPTLLASSVSIIDTRIPPEHCEFLKYAAAAYLLKYKTDQDSIAREQAYMATFNQLIGVA